MKKSKLITLLSTFEPAEMRQFKDFVASPYFNKNQELGGFLEYLDKCAPEFDERKIEKERVYAAVFPGQPFDGKHLAYLMNYLLKLAEQFLMIQGIERENLLCDYQLLRQFMNRRLEKHFRFNFNKIAETLEALKGSGSDYFFFKHRISELASDFYFLQGDRPESHFHWQLTSDNLDDYYFLNKLKYCCEMINRQKVFSTDFHLRFHEELTQYLQQQTNLPPIIDLFLQTYIMMTHSVGEAHFENLMRLLRRHGGQIAKEELRIIYLYAINYSVRNISKGMEEYIPLTLDLYLEGIRSRALFENEYLTHSTYTNVIKLALMQKRFDWIESFIHEYSEYLTPKTKDDALHYNLAELYYHRRDYDRVLDHLNKLQFSDIQYHLGTRVVLIKTYYELDEIESLLSLLASFSVYLRRNNKIAAGLKKRYLNFCNLLHRILRRDPKKREQIKKQIETIQPLAERSWLQGVFESTLVMR